MIAHHPRLRVEALLDLLVARRAQPAAPTHQLNTQIHSGEDPRKFEVGRELRFAGYAKQEAFSVEDRVESERFQAGDIVRPVPANGCGMGIDVRRDGDGFEDMVWPEEVEVVEVTS